MASQISRDQHRRHVVGQEEYIEPEVERCNQIVAAVSEEPAE